MSRLSWNFATASGTAACGVTVRKSTRPPSGQSVMTRRPGARSLSARRDHDRSPGSGDSSAPKANTSDLVAGGITRSRAILARPPSRLLQRHFREKSAAARRLVGTEVQDARRRLSRTTLSRRRPRRRHPLRSSPYPKLPSLSRPTQAPPRQAQPACSRGKAWTPVCLAEVVEQRPQPRCACP